MNIPQQLLRAKSPKPRVESDLNQLFAIVTDGVQYDVKAKRSSSSKSMSASPRRKVKLDIRGIE